MRHLVQHDREQVEIVAVVAVDAVVEVDVSENGAAIDVGVELHDDVGAPAVDERLGATVGNEVVQVFAVILVREARDIPGVLERRVDEVVVYRRRPAGAEHRGGAGAAQAVERCGDDDRHVAL
jgi:hypothetical protein